LGGLKGKIGLLAASFVMMSYAAATPILANVAKSFPEASKLSIQMLTTMPCLVEIVISICMQWLTPHISKKRLIIISGIINLFAGILLYFYHPTIISMIVISGTLGIVNGVGVPCVPGLICDTYNERESGILLGMQGGFISGGAMVFMWISGQLSVKEWKNAYLVFLLMIPAILAEILLLPEGKLDPKKSRTEKRDKIPSSIWIYTALLLIFNTLIYAFNTNISMLVDVRGFGGSLETSYVTTFYGLAGLAAGCSVGFIIPKLRQQTYSLAVVLSVVGTLICYFSPSLLLLRAGGVFCGLGFTTMVPAANYFASMESTDYNRMFCVAMINTGCNCGIFLSPVVFGALHVTTEKTFLGAAVGLAILLIPTIALSALYIKNDSKSQTKKAAV